MAGTAIFFCLFLDSQGWLAATIDRSQMFEGCSRTFRLQQSGWLFRCGSRRLSYGSNVLAAKHVRTETALFGRLVSDRLSA